MPYRGFLNESSWLPQNSMPQLPMPPKRNLLPLPQVMPPEGPPRFEDNTQVQAPMPPTEFPIARPPIQLGPNPMGVVSPRQAEERIPPPPQMARPQPQEEPIEPDNPNLARRDPFQVPANIRQRLQPPQQKLQAPQIPMNSGPVNGGLKVNIDEGDGSQPINPMSSMKARNVFGRENRPFGASNISFTPPSAMGKQKLLSPRDTEESTTSQVSTDGKGGSIATPSDRYEKFLESYPDRNAPEFKHTKMDKVGAILAGIAGGGIEAGRRQYNRKYDTAVGDFNNKAEKLKEGANLEVSLENSKSNDANRQSLITARTARNALAKFKAENPNAIFKSIPGGNIMGFDPQHPDKPIDTGVKSGTADAETMQDYAIDRIVKTGQEARKTEGVRQQGRVKIEQMKIDNPDYRYIPTKGGNWMAVSKKDPDDIHDTGVESGIMTDEELAEARKELKAAPNAGSETTSETEINKEGTKSTTKRTTKPVTGTTPPKDNTKTTTAEETITMKSPDGKTGQVKKSNVTAAKAAGYTEVK